MAKPRLGAQLYTVRQFTKTLDGVVETFGKVRDIGYTAVQMSGFGPVDPKEVAKAVADSGLEVAATHMGWGRFLNELDAVIEEHKMWKCSHPAIGGLPGEYREAEGVKRFVDELAPVAEKLAAAGMDFSYHNHNHEFRRVVKKDDDKHHGGKVWLAELYETAPPDVLKAEIDTYWVAAGGGDPAAWVRKCAGREPLLHLKDMTIGENREQLFAEIGEGNLNWPAILSAADESGVEWLLIEQDNCYDRDPFESLAISYRNLKEMGYE